MRMLWSQNVVCDFWPKYVLEGFVRWAPWFCLSGDISTREAWEELCHHQELQKHCCWDLDVYGWVIGGTIFGETVNNSGHTFQSQTIPKGSLVHRPGRSSSMCILCSVERVDERRLLVVLASSVQCTPSLWRAEDSQDLSGPLAVVWLLV